MKILLFGEQNSGKDTVAEMLRQNADIKGHGIVEQMALADPLKRIAQKLFGCTDEQLWGPSEARNAATIPADHRLLKVTHLIPGETCDHIDQWLSQDLRISGRDARSDARESFFGWIRSLHVLNGAAAGTPMALSPRKILQTMGTEWGRSVDRQIWIKTGARIADELLNGGFTYDRAKGLVKKDGHFPGSVVITDGRFRNEALGMKSLGFKIVNVVVPSLCRQDTSEPKHASEMEQRTIPPHWFDARLFNTKDGLVYLHHKVEILVDHLYEGGKAIG